MITQILSVPFVMAGLVPAIRRGSGPLLMAGTSPVMTVYEQRAESTETALGIIGSAPLFL
jgi:hypothetical protein